MEKKYNNIEMSLLDYVKENNKGHKDFVAINYLGRKILFSEFLENVEKTKQKLIESSIKKDDIVSILYLATPEVIYLIYALDDLGVAINFLNPIEPESIKETLEQENPNLVICYDQFYPLLKDFVDARRVIITNPTDSLPLGIRLIGKASDLIQKKNVLIPNETITWQQFMKDGIKLPSVIVRNEENNGLHLGTGGSSGLPKQVQISSLLLNNIVKQHYLMSNSKAFNISINRGEVLLDVIPPHLGYGVCDIHLALSIGLELAIEPDPNPEKFVSSILKYKPNFILAGPIHWKKFNSYEKNIKTPYIKIAVSGGEPLEAKVEDITNEKLLQRGSTAQVHEGVGLTEIAGVATYNSDPSNAKYTVGRPLPEYKVGIFEADLEDEEYDNTRDDQIVSMLYYEKRPNDEFEIAHKGNLGKNNTGEICYQLPIKVDGYIKKYAKENGMLIKKHENGEIWIHTGDVGYIREDRNIVIVDRIKRVFNCNGFKVYPRQLEDIAQNSGLIEECIIIPRKSAIETEANVPVMYAVLKPGFREEGQAFIEYCRNNINGNSSIYKFIFVDELPRTGAGKKGFKYVQLYDSIAYPMANSNGLEIDTPVGNVLTLKKMKEKLS